MSDRYLVPEQLPEILARYPATTGYRVAFSGGVDSLALLHALAAVRSSIAVPVRAVHVNHGLHPGASCWEQHCASICTELGVELEVHRVEVRTTAGASVEERAREARYEALAVSLDAGETLLTAHQRNDQVETMLLHLLRGAGPHGLCAMPQLRRFYRGYLGRPLLGYTRAALARYVREAGLRAVEDTSNSNLRFARNFLRHRILPVLQQRWPDLGQSVARAQDHQREAVELIDSVCNADLQRIGGAQGLSCAALAELSVARLHFLLRAWVADAGLPLPAEKHLERIRGDLLEQNTTGTGMVCWPGAECRRYRGWLRVAPPLLDHDPTTRQQWRLGGTLELAHGRLTATSVRGEGLRLPKAPPVVTVRYRLGGERCRPAGRRHSQRLKKLLQEAAVPPWMRDRIPLIYFEETLAAVAGQWVCEGFQARDDEQGWLVEWNPSDAKRGV